VLSQEKTSQPGRERLQMGTRMCRNVGEVDKEKTLILNVPQTVFPICITQNKFPGAEYFYRKNGSWETIFPLKISVWGTKIFRTKIPVTAQMMLLSIIQSAWQNFGPSYFRRRSHCISASNWELPFRLLCSLPHTDTSLLPGCTHLHTYYRNSVWERDYTEVECMIMCQLRLRMVWP